jgi:hypothetical protein
VKATEAKLQSFLQKSPQFIIPIYQRTYSWTDKECRQTLGRHSPRRVEQHPSPSTSPAQSASRNAGFVLAVSDLALIMLAAPDESLAHDGMSPHRISDNWRTGSFGC